MPATLHLSQSLSWLYKTFVTHLCLSYGILAKTSKVTPRLAQAIAYYNLVEAVTWIGQAFSVSSLANIPGTHGNLFILAGRYPGVPLADVVL